MERKVIKQGPATFMVSLPSKWVKKYGVSRGDPVQLEENGPRLIVSTGRQAASQGIEFDARGIDSGTVKRYLDEMHKLGYDEIKVLFDRQGVVREIQELTRSVLMGFEIIDQGKGHLVIKCISAAGDEDFDAILRRIFLITMQFAENMREAISDSDRKRIESLFILEETNDKLTNYCERVLNKRGYRDSRKDNILHCLVWTLEKIADDHKYLGRYFIENKDLKPDEDTLALYAEANSLLRDYYNLYYNYDIRRVQDFTKQASGLISRCHSLLGKVKGKEDVMISYLTVSISKVFNLVDILVGINV